MAARWYASLASAFFRAINRHWIWYQLPFPLAVSDLVSIRADMRKRNLYDTETAPEPPPVPEGFDVRHCRTFDGSFNDLAEPWMGRADTRFGRNVPIPETHGEAAPALYEPNPRLVSDRLLSRKTFVPATSVNVLLPAWLQFMVHDWLSHGPNAKENPHRFPVPEGDDWNKPEMTVLRTRPDSKRGPADAGRPATYRNMSTHWWDGSQIYGSDLQLQYRARSDPAKHDFAPDGTMRPLTPADLLPDGKLWLDERGQLPLDRDPAATGPTQEFAPVNGNWWVGLSVMHTLFAREHNAIVDRLRLEYPDKDGEWLFQKARLINAALIVKIHATEWTPALLQMPTLQYAMRASWWGILGEEYDKAHGRTARNEILTGIPLSPQEHYAAPYSITEEFTAVYRMHSLIPDDFSFRRHDDDKEVVACSLLQVFGDKVHPLYGRLPLEDVLYSLASSYPGALVLHNYPNNLRRIPEKDDIFNDLAAIDVLRDRERGVPRYCAFRRHLRMSVPASFAELTDNPDWQRELQAIYGDVEKVDLLVGMHAEKAPPGFAISDTAFRIFILMAGRRIKSDRFLTDDFTPEVYTPVGIDWVERNLMRDVILRHAPALAPRFADVRNMFFPWSRAGS
jgi:Animal haem peroxidase